MSYRQHLYNITTFMKQINGKRLAQQIRTYLKQEVKRQFLTKKKSRVVPKLVVLSVRATPEGASFIKTKEKATHALGGNFELVSFRRTPRFEEFAGSLREVASNPKVTGIVIQKPLPSQLNTVTLFDYVPIFKEIEGHKHKSPFYPPIGLAVLTVIKYIYSKGDKRNIKNIIVDMDKDMPFFRQLLKRKRIVVVGRGETGGKPLGEVLNRAKVNFININSQTPNPEAFLVEADIIITAVGRKVIKPEYLKKGVVLINIGLRREGDEWKGDYDEDEIKDIASFYTPTPGGVGPLDIAYLMYNLVEATKLQKKTQQ